MMMKPVESFLYNVYKLKILMINEAIKIIQTEFANKVDKAGQPYIHHLERVAQKVTDEGLPDEVKIVALLHDLLEDAPEWNENKLRKFFTEKIIESILALTHKPNQTYDEYIEQVCRNQWATHVKKADLEDNMDITRLNELTDIDIERLKKYHKAYRHILSVWPL